jgi:hypothetical protein
MLNDIIDEQVEVEGFHIDNDTKAEWALSKIKAERDEALKYAFTCKEIARTYDNKAKEAMDKAAQKTSGLEGMLRVYFDSVPHKATKTQETYKLPGGVLKKKFGTVEFVRDDKVLVDFLKSNNYTDYLETKYFPKWAELKKDVTVSGNLVINDSGEVVEGVTAVERPDTFVVELEA